jgi:hypothetical protein
MFIVKKKATVIAAFYTSDGHARFLMFPPQFSEASESITKFPSVDLL